MHQILRLFAPKMLQLGRFIWYYSLLELILLSHVSINPMLFAFIISTGVSQLRATPPLTLLILLLMPLFADDGVLPPGKMDEVELFL
jgi:hypothetical protein